MEKSHYNFYNKNLKNYSRELRSRNTTKAERYLWKSVLSKRATGVRFLRQRPILYFIVDFYTPELNLIIEIDGSSHYSKPEHDFHRQTTLTNLGNTLIRFSEGEILNNLDEVELTIRNVIYSLQNE
jgi:very-short-patch-repair endonuclease